MRRNNPSVRIARSRSRQTSDERALPRPQNRSRSRETSDERAIPRPPNSHEFGYVAEFGYRKRSGLALIVMIVVLGIVSAICVNLLRMSVMERHQARR